ncbi:hypothetical protein G4B88_007275, partial [Cannabis sativa]
MEEKKELLKEDDDDDDEYDKDGVPLPGFRFHPTDEELEVWTLCRIFKRIPSYKKYVPADNNNNKSKETTTTTTTTKKSLSSSSSSSLLYPLEYYINNNYNNNSDYSSSKSCSLETHHDHLSLELDTPLSHHQYHRQANPAATYGGDETTPTSTTAAARGS